jgi:hypothetical protein
LVILKIRWIALVVGLVVLLPRLCLGAVDATFRHLRASDLYANLNGVVETASPSYVATGSTKTYQCSIVIAGGLNCPNDGNGNPVVSNDFGVGQWLMLEGAGISSPITAASGVTVTNVGTAGSTNVCYEVLEVDPAGGSAAISSAGCNATGPSQASIGPASGLKVVYASNGNANSSGVMYRSFDGGSTYACIGVTQTSPYYDMGKIGDCMDWPATPPGSPLKQAFWTQITGGGGLNWTVFPNPPNNSNLNLTRHDDTQAIQAAIAAACANGGGKVELPVGEVHLNQYALFNGSTTLAGYNFTNATSGYEAYGNIILQCSNLNIVGAGEGATILIHDFPMLPNGRGHFFSMVPTGYAAPGAGPQAANGSLNLTGYAINAVKQGSDTVTTTSAGNAVNFPTGYVYLTGGAAFDGNYSKSFITANDVPGDAVSGNIKLRDNVPDPLPYGTVGVATTAVPLTINSTILVNTTLSDFSYKSAGPLIAFDASYNTLLTHINQIGPPGFNGQSIYGQWFGKLKLDDVDLVSGGQTQFTVSSDLTITNSKLHQYYGYHWSGAPSMFIQFHGISPLNITRTNFDDACNTSVVIDSVSNDVIFNNNRVSVSCGGVTPAHVSQFAALSLGDLSSGSGSSYVPSSWVATGNVVTGWYTSALAGGSNIQSLSIISNVIKDNGRDTGSGPVVQLDTGYSLRFSDNQVDSNGVTNTSSYAVLYNPQAPSSLVTGQTDFTENTLRQSGTDNLTCFYISNGGSTHTAAINVFNNHCIGVTNPMVAGLDVNSQTNTPNVLQKGNTMENVTTPYVPANVVCQVPTENIKTWIGYGYPLSTNQFEYIGFGAPPSLYQTNEAAARSPVPAGTMLCHLFCYWYNMTGGSGVTASVLDSGSSSGMTCSSAVLSGCHDDTDVYTVVGGIDIEVFNQGPANTGTVVCSMQD